MNEPDDELTLSEAEGELMLRSVPLRPPTASLDARVTAALTGRRSHPVRWAAAAAVVLLGAGVTVRTLHRNQPAPVAQMVPVLSPVSVEREVTRTIDDGVVAITNRVPYRQVRRQTVREIWWTDPATGARLWAELPDEQVTVEPAETF